MPRHVTHRVRERHRCGPSLTEAPPQERRRDARQTSIPPTTRASRETQPPSVSRVSSAARACHRLGPVSAGRLLSINEAWLAGVPVVSCDYLVNRRFEERHGPLMWLVPTPPRAGEARGCDYRGIRRAVRSASDPRSGRRDTGILRADHGAPVGRFDHQCLSAFLPMAEQF